MPTRIVAAGNEKDCGLSSSLSVERLKSIDFGYTWVTFPCRKCGESLQLGIGGKLEYDKLFARYKVDSGDLRLSKLVGGFAVEQYIECGDCLQQYAVALTKDQDVYIFVCDTEVDSR